MNKSRSDELTAQAAINFLKAELVKGNVTPHEIITVLEGAADQMEEWAMNKAKQTSSVSALLHAFHRLASFGEIASNMAKKVNKSRTFLKEVVIPERFEADDLKTVTLDELGYRFTVSTKTRASIVSGMKDDAIKWFNDNGFEDIPQLTVNASTLSALAKQFATENRELPEELFNQQIFSNTSMTKTK